jgi:hypothetical protein
MRRVQNSTPITDFGGRKQISFDALFSSDSEEESSSPVAKSGTSQVEATTVQVQGARHLASSSSHVASPPSPDFPYCREDDPISVWTQKVTESFEKASKKQLPPDFKESLGRLSFFRKPAAAVAPQQQNSVAKEQTSTTTVHPK